MRRSVADLSSRIRFPNQNRGRVRREDFFDGPEDEGRGGSRQIFLIGFDFCAIVIVVDDVVVGKVLAYGILMLRVEAHYSVGTSFLQCTDARIIISCNLLKI